MMGEEGRGAMEIYKRGSAIVFKSAGKRIDQTGSALFRTQCLTRDRMSRQGSLAVPRGGNRVHMTSAGANRFARNRSEIDNPSISIGLCIVSCLPSFGAAQGVQ